jgi:hypothetical protein
MLVRITNRLWGFKITIFKVLIIPTIFVVRLSNIPSGYNKALNLKTTTSVSLLKCSILFFYKHKQIVCREKLEREEDCF